MEGWRAITQPHSGVSKVNKSQKSSLGFAIPISSLLITALRNVTFWLFHSGGRIHRISSYALSEPLAVVDYTELSEVTKLEVTRYFAEGMGDVLKSTANPLQWRDADQGKMQTQIVTGEV